MIENGEIDDEDEKIILVTLFLDKETDDWKKEIRVKLIWIHPHQI